MIEPSESKRTDLLALFLSLPKKVPGEKLMFTQLIIMLSLYTTPVVQTSYIIQGQITDDRHNQVRNIRVLLMNDVNAILQTAITDGSGRYEFRSTGPGTYILQVEPAGSEYVRQSRRLTIASLTDSRMGREVLIEDFALKFIDGKNPSLNRLPVFAQNVPEAAKNEFDKALKLITGSKADEAEIALTEAIKVFPDYFEALETLGALQIGYGKYENALTTLGHAVEINPKASASLYSMGIALINLKRMPEACDALRKSIAYDPNSPNANLKLGYALIANRQFAEAEEPLKTAFKLGGKKVIESKQYLAVIYDKLGRYKEAVIALEAYVKDAPKEVDKEKFRVVIVRLKKKVEASGK